jgi:hypothetical protein
MIGEYGTDFLFWPGFCFESDAVSIHQGIVFPQVDIR